MKGEEQNYVGRDYPDRLEKMGDKMHQVMLVLQNLALKVLYVYFQFESLIVQVVHNCCCQHNFLQQLKLEQLINMEKRDTHPSTWIHVEQFSISIFPLCIMKISLRHTH